MMQKAISTNALGTRDASKPKQLLEGLSPLVRFLAESIPIDPGKDADIDDLCALSLAGLQEACAKYEPRHNLEFAMYIQLHVRCAMTVCQRGDGMKPT